MEERRLPQARLSEQADTLDRRVAERTAALRDSEAQLREADRRKDEFLATLAHELRNPLAPVRNAVHLVRLGVQGPKLAWAGELIERQIQLMSRLIDDLMDVSRINQGKIELRTERIDVDSFVGDAIEMAQPMIDEMEHRLVVSRAPGPVYVQVDRTRMAQAVMNLLNNAAKYMDKGGRIELTTRHEGDRVRICVRDHGVGIPADRLQTVFELFSQVESALSRSRGGLGIGLSLTRRLVGLHGGTVEAYSEGAGKGSEFVIELPVVGG